MKIAHQPAGVAAFHAHSHRSRAGTFGEGPKKDSHQAAHDRTAAHRSRAADVAERAIAHAIQAARILIADNGDIRQVDIFDHGAVRGVAEQSGILRTRGVDIKPVDRKSLAIESTGVGVHGVAVAVIRSNRHETRAAVPGRCLAGVDVVHQFGVRGHQAIAGRPEPLQAIDVGDLIGTRSAVSAGDAEESAAVLHLEIVAGGEGRQGGAVLVPIAVLQDEAGDGQGGCVRDRATCAQAEFTFDAAERVVEVDIAGGRELQRCARRPGQRDVEVDVAAVSAAADGLHGFAGAGVESVLQRGDIHVRRHAAAVVDGDVAGIEQPTATFSGTDRAVDLQRRAAGLD